MLSYEGMVISMIKLLFQGDSITDWGRNHDDPHDVGWGYARYAYNALNERFPNQIEYINLGIGGNLTKDLVDRIESDFVAIQPDVVSILIGINDVWAHAGGRDWMPDEEFEANYRKVLDALKNRTNAKIMLIEPFLIPVEDKLFFREDLYRKIEVVRKLAREYALAYLPLDGLLASAYNNTDPVTFAEDGVHPTQICAKVIGEHYADYIAPIIESLL